MSWIVANKESLPAFYPELVLIGGAILTLLLGAFTPRARVFILSVTTLTLMAFMGLSLRLLTLHEPTVLFSGAIMADSFAVFFKIFFGLVSVVTLVFVARSKEFQGYGSGEISAFLLALTLGMSMMAAANDLLMVFLSLEMVSVLSYVLVGYKKHNRFSSEAGLKYILFGAVASGIMIFGLSYVFGLVGSTDFGVIARYFQVAEGHALGPVLIFALLCTMMGLGYKIATFPSHMWCPDVYEGAPLPVTAFLSVGPKAAGFAMTIRFFYTLFDLHGGQGVDIFQFIHGGEILAGIAAVTMTLGNLAAIPQRNLKRLMAYSSIAHAGYLLMAFSTLSAVGVQAILFYLVAYLLMNFGAFFVILVVANQIGTEEIDGYQGLGWRSPILGVALTIFLFSLTGLPPFAGFVGKFFLFAAVIQHDLYWLAVVGAINTVISLFYYARIIKAMYFHRPVDLSPIPVTGVYKLMAMALAVPVLVLGIYWKPLWIFASTSVKSLF